MIPDGSVDFVFSFDSFVHPDREIVEAYLRQLGAKLKIGGKGFIHHSNFGEYVNSARERLPEALAKPLIKAKILDWAHHRNPSMTAEIFRTLSERNGLQCLSQELVNWRGRRLIDCLSLFVRTDSAPENPTKIIRNPNFMREAARIRRQWQTSGLSTFSVKNAAVASCPLANAFGAVPSGETKHLLGPSQMLAFTHFSTSLRGSRIMRCSWALSRSLSCWQS